MSWLIQRAVANLLVGLVAFAFVGCAARQQPAQPDPTTRLAVEPAGDGLLRSLREVRAQTESELQAIGAALEAHRRQHPQLDERRDVGRQRLLQISQALTAAELDLIDAKTKHAAGHPAVASATMRVEEIRSLYNESLAELARLDTPASERRRLLAEMELKHEFLSRLNERIQQLEGARA